MRLIGTITLLCISFAAAQAQEGGRRPQGFGPEGRGGGRGGPGFNIGFTALDTNGDNEVSAQEIAAAETSLKKLDKNGDGKIEEAEVRPAMPEGRGRGGREGGGREGGGGNNTADDVASTLMAFDKDGDGKLTRAEVPERMQGVFDRGDENKDGVLSAEEVRKMATSQAAPTELAGRGGRGGPEMSLVRMDPVLAAVDADANGSISAEEIRNSPASLKKLDQNGDGKITQDEARPAMGRGRG
jgi:Ca2+-binding EF-hand superfamily protein